MKFPSFLYAAGESGGSQEDTASEFTQDLADIGAEEGGEADAEGSDESTDDSRESRQDSRPPRRNRERAEEDTEDTGDEDEEGDESEEESEDEDREGKLEDLDEEEEQTETPVYARPPIKAIKEKYPNFFKDFPQLKAAFFGYPQYAELFADVDSAREAVGKAQEYDTLEATLVGKGDARPLLNALSENNPKALKKMVADFSHAVREIDQDVYLQLANPIIEELLYHADAHGTKVGNRNLQLAARHIANFVFANGGEIPNIARREAPAKQSEAEVQLEQEREQYSKEKFEGALGKVVELIKPDITAILNNKLEGLTGFERKQIVKEARGEVDRILSNDKGFQSSLRTLWKKSEATGYSNESLSRIKRAWLDRARLIAPSVRNRLRQEAISSRTGAKRTGEKAEGQESKVSFKVTDEKRKFPSGAGKTPNQNGQRRVLDPKQIDWRKTSDRDILDMK